MIADGDDRNERWHEHDPTRWWSFEFAVVKSLLAASKLPGVYCEETQIMNCYLYMIANYANDTYNHKYYVVNAWAIINEIWVRHSNLREKHSFPSNLSDELRFEWRTQIWVKPSGIPQIWVNHQIWAITQNWGNHVRSPRIECFAYFWGWSSTCLVGMWLLIHAGININPC